MQPQVNESEQLNGLGGAKSTPVDPSTTIIGKIHANWCGHCKSLVPEWEKMKSAINSAGLEKKYKFVEIESANQGPKIKYINNHHLKNSDSKLSLQGGYPTLFKIKNGKLTYYKGPRRAIDMTNWYTNHAVKVASDANPKVTKKTWPSFMFGGKKRRNRTQKTRSKKNRKTRNKKAI